MIKYKFWMVCLISTCLGICNTSVASTVLQSKAQETLAKLGDTQTVIKGRDGFLFFKSELNYISKGSLTSADSSKLEVTAAILDFNQQLKKAGIKLIIIPVPAKSEIYPDKLFSDAVEVSQNPQEKFYQELEKSGIHVLDLFPLFIKETVSNVVYCKQDSHWNAKGIEVAVNALTDTIRKEKWYKAQNALKTVSFNIEVQGDLAKDLNQQESDKETLVLTRVDGRTVDEASPILVIGDSHTLIFHSGDDMLAENAGFVDQLAAALKMPIDLIGVRGSGATPVRINLYRKASKQPEWLKNKKVVVWCFAVREFSQSQSGWKKIPLFKQ